MSGNPFRVRLAQLAPRLGDVAANLASHIEIAEAAAGDGIDLLVFPELSLTGYYLRDLTSEVALTREAPTLARLARISERVSLVVGFVEESPQYGLFAAQAFFEGGRLHHVHRKVYLPTYGMFDEGRYLSPGRTVAAFDTRCGRMGLLVCEDIWHPVLPFLLAQQGMHTLIVTANSPTRGVAAEGLAIRDTYAAMLATYARLFQVYVVMSNRVGYEDGVNFWGGSSVVAPGGEVVAQAPLFQPALLDAEVAPAEVRRARMLAPLVEEEDVELAARELRRIADERARH